MVWTNFYKSRLEYNISEQKNTFIVKNMVWTNFYKSRLKYNIL